MTDPIEDIIADIAAGKMVVMMDDEARENEGDLIMAAEHATPEAVAFFVRHTSGIICQPMTGERLESLLLPQMVPENTESHRTAFTISVDYRHGTTTGISAADRAATVRALATGEVQPSDFARPGHIFPLRAEAGGVLRRAGHTEAAVDLAKLAGCAAHTGIICEIVNDDGTMKRAPALREFAAEHGLKIGTIADLISYRLQNEHTVERVAQHVVETAHGAFQLYLFQDRIDQSMHLALARGDVDSQSDADPVLVRVHVRNTLADVLTVQHADFGWPLDSALERIAQEDRGVAVILQTPETADEMLWRVANMDKRADAAPAHISGEDNPQELRTYGIGAQILADLGVRKMRVLSAPKRMHAISGFGLEVTEYVQ
ncbi:3,4-dihydroxy-2-butanone-4-phosphate synthase [bacterium]|nr:3,4-dihydroxy-2-butanone-4-phosphate synthase [bacterium]